MAKKKDVPAKPKYTQARVSRLTYRIMQFDTDNGIIREVVGRNNYAGGPSYPYKYEEYDTVEAAAAALQTDWANENTDLVNFGYYAIIPVVQLTTTLVPLEKEEA